MSEQSCGDLKMERFRLVLRSFNEGGWKATLKLPFPSHQQSLFSQILPDS